MSERAPIIVAEFDFEGQTFQTVWWTETDDEAGEWDVVRADLPYVWAGHSGVQRGLRTMTEPGQSNEEDTMRAGRYDDTWAVYKDGKVLVYGFFTIQDAERWIDGDRT